MSMNEADTRYHLIDPLLRAKGYVSRAQITLETILTPAPVEPTGAKGRRRKGPGRTDYLLCVQIRVMPKPLPIAVLESKREGEDPLAGMQQAKGYADGERFDVNDVFATNGHRYGEFDCVTHLQSGPFPFSDFPPHDRLLTRYAKDSGIDLTQPEAAILFQADSPAWALSRATSRLAHGAASRASHARILTAGATRQTRLYRRRTRSNGRRLCRDGAMFQSRDPADLADLRGAAGLTCLAGCVNGLTMPSTAEELAAERCNALLRLISSRNHGFSTK